VRTPKKMALGYDVGKISTGCLVAICNETTLVIPYSVTATLWEELKIGAVYHIRLVA